MSNPPRLPSNKGQVKKPSLASLLYAKLCVMQAYNIDKIFIRRMLQQVIATFGSFS